MTAPSPAGSLAGRFLQSATRFRDRPALEVAGSTWSYDELSRRATGIAQLLAEQDAGGAGPELTAVLAARTPATYAAILGILFRGHGYVPLNPRFPARRNREILERSRCRVLIADDALLERAGDIIAGVQQAPRVLAVGDAPEAEAAIRAAGSDETPAYLLFTSGSTGHPKGVLVRQANVVAFLDAISARYDLNETDRLSQLFDLTFDLSAFDLFAAWDCGACVCSPDPSELLRPADFVRKSALTVWFSVPSAALLLERLGGLNPNMFPRLRLSLFCGEALPAALADSWSLAAPNSLVENLYGPTEATIACTAHRWQRSAPPGANGFVPIGEPLGATQVHVVDEGLREVVPGEAGQLLLTGPQVVEGYWDDPAATARAFVTLEAGVTGYLTGDRVVRRAPDAPLEFLGRVDSQIKILGHRVELEEVEAVVREEAQADVVAVGWPLTPSGAAGIVAFIASETVDPVAIRRALGLRLPDYMVPRELRLVSDLPLNVNGKRDRQALLAILEAT